MKNSFRTIFLIVLLCAATHASAEDNAPSAWTDGFSFSVRDGDHLSAMFSPYTHHFHHSDDHRYVWLIGVERERANGLLSGAAYFSNSFGQLSTYIFPWGQIYRNIGNIDGLFAKWTAGLLYGYTGKYEDKVPFNHNGFSPGLIPSLGYESNGWQTQVYLLGTAGLMLEINKRIF